MRRPVMVWVISVSYILSVLLQVISIYLEFAGIVPISTSAQRYFSALGPIDWISFTLSIVLTFWAAISLLKLRQIAVLLFALALVINIATSTWEIYIQGYDNFVSPLHSPAKFFVEWILVF